MINEKRLKTMIKLASYEKNQGKEDFKIIRRFKFDYISLNGFAGILLATIALIILFGLNFLEDFIANMARITEFDFVGTGIGYLTIWILVIVVYAFASGRLYRSKYRAAKKRVDTYRKTLHQLDDDK